MIVLDQHMTNSLLANHSSIIVKRAISLTSQGKSDPHNSYFIHIPLDYGK